MRSWTGDAVYALRLLRRSPGFAALGLAVIALGIGPTTAIFSIFYGILLRPLPFPGPDRLAVVWSDFSRLGGNPRAYSSPADFFDWRERSRSFEAMAALNNTNRTFTGMDTPITPLTHEVTDNYFDVLGVQAVRGRTFLPGEGQRGHDDVAIISYPLWQAAFGGADSAIGRNIELDGRSARLIGVLPATFRVPNNVITAQPDLWVPHSFDEQRLDRGQRGLVVFGRLRQGVALAQAQTEMVTISQQIARDHAGNVETPAALVRSIRDDLTGDFHGTLLLLLGAVGMILLIACANVANLLLARCAGRGQEFALRTALGASRGQLVRQMLTESSMLSLAGGLLGILIARASLAPLLALVPESSGLPFTNQVAVSWPVLLFASALMVMTSVLFGLLPARQAFRTSLAESLKEGGRSRTAGRGAHVGRNLLIIGEVALSLILLVGAGLMIQTFWRLSRVNWGFDATHVLTVRNSLRGEAYAAAAARRTHFSTAAARLGELPGVESVSAVSFTPPLGAIAATPFARMDRAADPGREASAFLLVVMPRYFETMRIPVLAGRGISDADTADGARVLVITQALAKRYFPGEDPVGRGVRLTGRNTGTYRIVGVAGDTRGTGLSDETHPVIYAPYAQWPASVMTFVIRTRQDPGSLGPRVERTIWSMGHLMNVYQTMPLEQHLAETFWQSRFTMILLSLFAGLALVLAAAGIYAVISYLASQRTREIGVRMALGARPRDVLWMVTSQGVRLAVAGVALGSLGAAAMQRALATQLYGVSAADPLTFGVVAGVLLTVAAAACVVPAIRAARVDPIEALRLG